jgi:hypothetical protein
MTAGEFLYKIWANNTKDPGKILGLVPACNGLETPIRDKTGLWALYVFNVFTGKHYYIDLDGHEVRLWPS